MPDLLEKILHSKIVRLITIILIVYTLIIVFDVDVDITKINTIFQIILITTLVSWAVISFYTFLNKRINALRKVLKDIRIIKSIKKDINMIKKQQQADRKELTKIKKYLKTIKETPEVKKHIFLKNFRGR